jgi:hypothetical protein
MSAVSNLTASTGTERPDAGPGLLALAEMALRLVLGWLCLMIAVFDLLVDLDRQTRAVDVPFLLFHAVLLVGGGLLLGLGWFAPRPRLADYLTGGAILVFGSLLSSLPATTTVCCLPAYAVRHGYPFAFAGHDDGGRWHVDGPYLIADVLFWALAGLIVLIVIAMLRRAARHPESDGEAVGPLP